MLRLEPTNNNQTIRFIPSDPYFSFLSYEIVNAYVQRVTSDGGVIEGYSCLIDDAIYTFVFVDEETKDVNLVTINQELVDNGDGVISVTSQWGFTQNQENRYVMMYVMTKPYGANITSSNYLDYFGYVFYTCKIFLMSNNNQPPQLYSVNGANYNQYEQQPSDNDFIIL